MCSIAGILHLNPLRGVSEEEMRRVGACMKHRGPDRSDAYFFTGGALHHNRLAVIDPEHGNQPMQITFGGKRYTIVYNGAEYFADNIFHLSEEQKQLAKDYEANLILFLNDETFN